MLDERSLLAPFLLSMARTTGLLIFVPLPGFRGLPHLAKVIMLLAISMLIMPGKIAAGPVPDLFPALIGEMVVGVCAALVILVLEEAFLLGLQTMSVQAGWSFASTIDPTTSADSGVLQVIGSLTCGLLFYATGCHRIVIATLCAPVPFPTQLLGPQALEGFIHFTATIFSIGIRVALPVIFLLIITDLTGAMLSRMNAQLQLLSLLFPTKMLLSLVTLSISFGSIVRLYISTADQTMQHLQQLLLGPR